GPGALRGNETLQNPLFDTTGLPVGPYTVKLKTYDDDSGVSTASSATVNIIDSIRLDMNYHVTPTTAANFTGMLNTHLYTPGGYGWVNPINEFDHGLSTPNDLLRDGHFGQSNSFRLTVPDCTYYVTLTMGDASAAHTIDATINGTQVLNDLVLKA